MSRTPAKMSRTAASLKRDFDSGFAEALPPSRESASDLLAVRLGGEAWAIALSEIAGLHADKRITPLPGAAPGLLGLAGFRGALVPVYDLAARIGLAPAQAPRWLVLAKERRVALAFAELEGHLRAEAQDLLPATPGGGAFTGGFIRIGGAKRPVLNLQSVLDEIPLRKDPPLEGSKT